jgi:cytochrome c-type biogenesis protein CcmF
MILIVAIGGSLTLYAVRAPGLKSGGLFAPISREGGLVINNLLLATATLTVFLGTLYPLFLEATGGAKVSVGPPFFNMVFVPLMVPLLLLVPVGSLLAWKRGDVVGALTRLWAAAAVVVVIVLATMWLRGGPAGALLGLGIAAWLMAGALVEWADRIRLFRAPLADSLARMRNLPRSAWGMTIAHFGLGVIVAGITATSAWQIERVQLMRVGDSLDIAGYSVKFAGTDRADGSNYQSRRAIFEVTSKGRPVVTMHPEKRFFPVQGMPTTEAAIHTTILADLYIVLGDIEGTGAPGGGTPNFLPEPMPDTAWTVRIYYNPLVPWIWIGAMIAVLGGLVSLTDRRHRVGAPRRARGFAAQPAQGD